DIAVRTGRRSEGGMFSAYTVLDKWAGGNGAFAAGAILSFIAFPTKALPGSVDPAILREMALIAIPIIATGSLGSVAVLRPEGAVPGPPGGRTCRRSRTMSSPSPETQAAAVEAFRRDGFFHARGLID